jgi:hypothetical protein
MGPETKNDSAGEDQQQFIRLDWIIFRGNAFCIAVNTHYFKQVEIAVQGGIFRHMYAIFRSVSSYNYYIIYSHLE